MGSTVSSPGGTSALPGPLFRLEEVTSTQDEARRLLDDVLPREDDPPETGIHHLLSVSAAFQSKGRGRQGRNWQAVKGTAALVSTAFVVSDAAAAARLGFRASLAIALLVERLSCKAASIKWPNDVLVNGAKLAGVLVESFFSGGVRVAIVGTGINVLDAPLPGSTCLSRLGLPIEPEEVLHDYLGLIAGMLEADDQVRERSEFVRRLIPPSTLTLREGEKATVKGALPGRFLVESGCRLMQIPFHSASSPVPADS